MWCAAGVPRRGLPRCVIWSVNIHVLCVVLQVFHDVAYHAHNREDLLAGIDEFLDQVMCKLVLTRGTDAFM